MIAFADSSCHWSFQVFFLILSQCWAFIIFQRSICFMGFKLQTLVHNILSQFYISLYVLLVAFLYIWLFSLTPRKCIWIFLLKLVLSVFHFTSSASVFIVSSFLSSLSIFFPISWNSHLGLGFFGVFGFLLLLLLHFSNCDITWLHALTPKALLQVTWNSHLCCFFISSLSKEDSNFSG